MALKGKACPSITIMSSLAMIPFTHFYVHFGISHKIMSRINFLSDKKKCA